MDKQSQQARIWRYLLTHKRGITSLDGFKLNPPVVDVGRRIRELIDESQYTMICSVWCDTKAKKRAYKRWFLM